MIEILLVLILLALLGFGSAIVAIGSLIFFITITLGLGALGIGFGAAIISGLLSLNFNDLMGIGTILLGIVVIIGASCAITRAVKKFRSTFTPIADSILSKIAVATSYILPAPRLTHYRHLLSQPEGKIHPHELFVAAEKARAFIWWSIAFPLMVAYLIFLIKGLNGEIHLL